MMNRFKTTMMVVLPLAIFASLASRAQGENSPAILTLQGAIDQALQVSRRVEDAKYDVKLATTSKLRNFAAMSPRFSVGGGYTHFDREVTIDNFIKPGEPPIIVRPIDVTLGTATITQPITALIAAIWNARVDTVKQYASEASLEKARAEVAFAAAQAYREVQQAEAIYQISQERVELTTKQRRDAESSFRLGRFSKSDVLRLDVLVNQAKVGVAGAKAGFEIKQAQLQDALDYNLDAPLVLEKMPDADQIHVATVSLPELEAARMAALDSRLDFKLAVLGRNAAGEGSILPWATLLPDVNFFVKWEHYFGNAIAFTNPTTQSLGLTLNWNIWDGGDRILAFRAARLQYYKARIKVVDAERGIALEVLQRRSDLIAAQDTLELQKSSVAQAQEAYRGVSERFRLGTMSVTELLEAEDTLNRTRVDMAKATTELDVKNMALQKAMGQTRPTSIL